jgi:hypothetical protein
MEVLRQICHFEFSCSFSLHVKNCELVNLANTLNSLHFASTLWIQSGFHGGEVSIAHLRRSTTLRGLGWSDGDIGVVSAVNTSTAVKLVLPKASFSIRTSAIRKV